METMLILKYWQAGLTRVNTIPKRPLVRLHHGSVVKRNERSWDSQPHSAHSTTKNDVVVVRLIRRGDLQEYPYISELTQLSDIRDLDKKPPTLQKSPLVVLVDL